jgi:hypothetical protein
MIIFAVESMQFIYDYKLKKQMSHERQTGSEIKYVSGSGEGLPRE